MMTESMTVTATVRATVTVTVARALTLTLAPTVTVARILTEFSNGHSKRDYLHYNHCTRYAHNIS